MPGVQGAHFASSIPGVPSGSPGEEAGWKRRDAGGVLFIVRIDEGIFGFRSPREEFII